MFLSYALTEKKHNYRFLVIARLHRREYVGAIATPTLLLVATCAYRRHMHVLGNHTAWLVLALYELAFPLFAVTCPVHTGG